MSQFFEVHPHNPQARLLKQAAQISLAAMRTPLAARELQLTPSPTDPLLWQVKHL
jgi:hypothetical protein